MVEKSGSSSAQSANSLGVESPDEVLWSPPNIEGVRSAGFKVELDSYQKTYAELYALRKRLEAAKVEVTAAREKIRAARPGGELEEVQAGWGKADEAAGHLEENVKRLDGMVNLVLHGLAESHAAYVQAESQGRAGLSKAAVDQQTMKSFDWKETL